MALGTAGVAHTAGAAGEIEIAGAEEDASPEAVGTTGAADMAGAAEEIEATGAEEENAVGETEAARAAGEAEAASTAEETEAAGAAETAGASKEADVAGVAEAAGTTGVAGAAKKVVAAGEESVSSGIKYDANCLVIGPRGPVARELGVGDPTIDPLNSPEVVDGAMKGGLNVGPYILGLRPKSVSNRLSMRLEVNFSLS